jgi:hypothetical protein
MRDFSGHGAFEALVRLLDGVTDDEEWRSLSPSIERLRFALREQQQKASKRKRMASDAARIVDRFAYAASR